jgi:hypothetical protein
MQDPEDFLRARDIAIGALRTIQALTQVGPDKAQDALQVIGAIIQTLYDGLNGKTTPDIVEAELKALADIRDREVSKQPKPVDERFDPGADDDSSPR